MCLYIYIKDVLGAWFSEKRLTFFLSRPLAWLAYHPRYLSLLLMITPPDSELFWFRAMSTGLRTSSATIIMQIVRGSYMKMYPECDLRLRLQCLSW